jgi:hypothetical protein
LPSNLLSRKIARHRSGSFSVTSEASGQVLGRHGALLDLSPVAGAEVRFVSGAVERLVTTDVAGEYRTVVPLGSYGITVSASGYEAASSGGVSVGPGGLTFGAVLVNGRQGPGTYDVAFVAQGLPSGLSFYRLSSETFSASGKLVLTK